MALLDRITSTAELRQLPESELPQVAQEVRERMVDVVSKVGGHFAPGLGVVELTNSRSCAASPPSVPAGPSVISVGFTVPPPVPGVAPRPPGMFTPNIGRPNSVASRMAFS